MTAGARAKVLVSRVNTDERPPRRIAVVPAYNEEQTVAAVLDQLYAQVDELVVVDDGSTDGTRREIEVWIAGHTEALLVVFERNRGMSAAYYEAFCGLRDRLHAGELDADDLVFSIDADGQHDLAVLDASGADDARRASSMRSSPAGTCRITGR